MEDRRPLLAARTGDPEFGKRLFELREAVGGRTQAQVADAVGTVVDNYSRWERGVAFPRAPQLRALCLYFDVSADYLLFGKSPPFRETDEWVTFLASPYGEIAEDRGWLEGLKLVQLPIPMTAQAYQNLVHLMLQLSP
jgi:transcriptional regulator with XRE-family HTH domain